MDIEVRARVDGVERWVPALLVDSTGAGFTFKNESKKLQVWVICVRGDRLTAEEPRWPSGEPKTPEEQELRGAGTREGRTVWS